jgi:hypothetical protein
MDRWKRCFLSAYDNRSGRQVVFLSGSCDGVPGVDDLGCNYSPGTGLEFVGEMADCFRVRTLGAFGCAILFDLVITVGRISRIMPPNVIRENALVTAKGSRESARIGSR